MKFTLILPIMNEIGSIKYGMESILHQTVLPNEIIIVDSFSTDGTYEYLKRLEQTVDFLKVIQKKTNIAEARNLAISQAQYPIILCTDAGTKLHSNRCEEMLKSLSQGFDVVGGNNLFLLENDFQKKVGNKWGLDFSKTAKYHISARNIGFYTYVWEKIGGYPEYLPKTGEDTHFNYKMIASGFKIGFNYNAIVQREMRKDQKGFSTMFYEYAKGDTELLIIHHYVSSVIIYLGLLSMIGILLFIFSLLFKLYIVIIVLLILLGLGIFMMGFFPKTAGGFLFSMKFNVLRLWNILKGFYSGIISGFMIKMKK